MTSKPRPSTAEIYVTYTSPADIAIENLESGKTCLIDIAVICPIAGPELQLQLRKGQEYKIQRSVQGQIHIRPRIERSAL